ncbi:MAG TPA: glycerol-3-phosphate dehydrogenase/oxidase [Alphaproteobacteria bacterium]|nr:glycerol-3-phosphate dehydrogenase/oxidase [Alphaproteobacteria bacterium]
MQRKPSAFTQQTYDVVVIGGGIFGICVAWDATLRGLSVALLEKGDFAHATSANCFKMVHGGFRYLQHADLYRIRESCRERSILLHIAPHLVHPLPIVIPTYGHGMQGKEVLKAALLAYGLITFDRNRGLQDPQQWIPKGYAISRGETLKLFPALRQEGLTGAIVFYDGQMYSPQRLALSFLRSAANAGAEVANYVEATGFLQNKARICGVNARDILSGDDLELRGRVVINAAGPWAEPMLTLSLGLELNPPFSYSRDACLVVRRRLTENYALALAGKTKDPDALLSRGNRHLFIVPWNHHTLVGVWHRVSKAAPDQVSLTQEELQEFITEINEACPALNLTPDDISMWNTGLVLFGDNQHLTGDLSFGKRSAIVDHAKQHQLEGLITVIGVRYTTARGVAEQAVNLAFEKLGRKSPAPLSAVTPIYGGNIERFQSFLDHALRSKPPNLRDDVVCLLVRHYGSEYQNVLRYLREDASWGEPLEGTTVLKAEVMHAVREEMAQKLSDVVFRRTALGTAGHPGEAPLRSCAELMGSTLGWDRQRTSQELHAVQAVFP